MTKQQFCDILGCLQRQNEIHRILRTKLGDLFDSYIQLDLLSEINPTLIKELNNALGVTNDDVIGWWLYEGVEKKIWINSREFDVSAPELLWDAYHLRDYSGVPNPKDVEAFNKYLFNNNEVLEFTQDWILIKNKFVENQLVLFSLKNISDLAGLTTTEVAEMLGILKNYKNCYIYQNAKSNKSVPDRFHLHIKL